MHLKSSRDNEYVQLLSHGLQERRYGEGENARVCDFICRQLEKMSHAVDQCWKQLAKHAVDLQIQTQTFRAARVTLEKRHILLNFKLSESLNEHHETFVVQYIECEDVAVTH